MKHKLLVILQIAIAFALTIVMLASGSAKAVTLKFQSSGKYAFVDFFNDSNCRMVSGFVQVSDEMFKDAPGSPVRPGPMGFLTVNIDNMCYDNDNDDDDYGYGYGYNYQWGTATIELTSFEISGNLRSASAEGKGTLIWIQPYYSYAPYPPYPYPPTVISPWPPYPPQPPPEEVTIKITWTGESDIESGHNNFRSSYGDMRTHVHSSGTFRYATATGLIKGETFEVEVKPPPPPQPYPTPVPITIDVEESEPSSYLPYSPYSPYLPPYPYPPPYYYYPAPYPYSYATIGKSKTGSISIFKP